MNFHFIGLTASLGFEARYLIVSEIAVYPANRPTDNAVLRFAAMTCGIAPHRTGEASSPSTVPASSATCSLLTNVHAVQSVSVRQMLLRVLDLLYQITQNRRGGSLCPPVFSAVKTIQNSLIWYYTIVDFVCFFLCVQTFVRPMILDHLCYPWPVQIRIETCACFGTPCLKSTL